MKRKPKELRHTYRISLWDAWGVQRDIIGATWGTKEGSFHCGDSYTLRLPSIDGHEDMLLKIEPVKS